MRRNLINSVKQENSFFFNCSHLYTLDLIGLRTSLCESLVSYVTRLAEMHCIPTGVLMEGQVAPLINKAHGGGNLHKIYEATAALNGTGVMSRDLVNAIEQLTQQQNLRFLTLLPWAEHLPTRNLLSQRRKWCSICYENWYKNKQTVYEPLLWALKVVDVCPKHREPLKQNCPHCHCPNSPLAWKSRPGYCYKCLSWLGSSDINETISFSENELKWKLWVANSIGELLAAAPILDTSSSKYLVSESLKTYVNITANGNIAEFARRIQIPRNTVWLWCEGKNQPQLEALLKICYCLNTSLLELLTQQLLEAQIPSRQAPVVTRTTTRAEAKTIDLALPGKSLERILLNHVCPPPSMEEVAKRLNLDRRTILRHFPEICHAISAKYTLYRKAAKQSTIERSRQEVKLAVTKLYNQNLYPSESRVSKLLTKPGFLRYKEVREVIDQTKVELGISPPQ